MSPREVIASIVRASGFDPFGHKQRQALLIADTIVAALRAAGWAIGRKGPSDQDIAYAEFYLLRRQLKAIASIAAMIAASEGEN